jgi:hypothetical protein
MHLLARSYGWDEMKLWEMPAKRRRLWAKMVRIQNVAEGGPAPRMGGGPPSDKKYRESE